MRPILPSLLLAALLSSCADAGKTHLAAPGDSAAASGNAGGDGDTQAGGDSAGSTGGDSSGSTGGDSSGSTGGESGGHTDTGPCVARSCEDLGYTCGSADDGCGASLDCGGCGAWTSCQANQCQAASCIPAEEDSIDGGGRCSDLDQAWTARGINVGYFPFRVLADTPQYSGDYGGAAGVTFTPGGGTLGVMLQTIPAGAYVGLASIGPWYNPSGECFPDGTCGSDSVNACSDSSPPLRPGVGGWYWGYAYQGASHMQGWIYADPTHLEWAGFDASHPCALGPAGADFEVASACGGATTCAGTNHSCGAVNSCTEGADDCGSTTCGAESGGALTPSAHTATLSLPASAVVCTESTPPDSRVLCLPNGGDVDFFFVYPFGAYLYWAQNSSTKAWLHYGDRVQSYYHTRDGQGVLWDFVEVLSSGAPGLTPVSDGAGGGGSCSSSNPDACSPCLHGGTCGWIQDVFLGGG